MRDDIVPRLIAAGVIATFLVLGISCEVRVWNECRAAGHSKVYCWRVLSK